MRAHRPLLSKKRSQTGAATLVVALVLLIAATITVLFSAQVATMEQRMSGNEIRAKQAAAAAQAGLEHALAYVSQGGEEMDETFASDLAGGSTYRAVLWDWRPDAGAQGPTAANACPDAPGFPVNSAANVPVSTDSLMVVSCGWSDDRAARSVVVVAALATPAFTPSVDSAPLISRSMVNTGGAGRIFNFFNNLTIWSGNALDVTGNAGTTFIRNPDYTGNDWTTLPVNCTTQAVAPTTPYICTTRDDTAGPDVIMGDPSLASLSTADFFAIFMGMSKFAYAEAMPDETITVPAGQTFDLSELANRQNEIIWIDGDADMQGSQTIGAIGNPVILIIDGDLDVGGGATIHGIVYVTGDLVAKGNADFFGTTIVEGTVTRAGGIPNFIYVPISVDGETALTRLGIVSGTWRDWL